QRDCRALPVRRSGDGATLARDRLHRRRRLPRRARLMATAMPAFMSAAEPSRGASCAPSGGSAAATAASVGGTHPLKFASPLLDEATIAAAGDVLRSGHIAS